MALKFDLTGQVFTRWTAQKHLGGGFWDCVCTCGTRGRVSGYDLRDQSSKGCKNCADSLQRARHPINPVFSHVAGNAKQRNIEFTLTRDYAWDLFQKQGAKCALTGIPLVIQSVYRFGYRAASNASLDRIDSTKGYVPGNVQWVYRPVNNMKWKLPQDEFIRLCKLVAELHK